MFQKFTGQDVKKCVSFLIKVRELQNLKIKVSLLVLFMLFFSAENHCRQKNTLVSTKINQIVVKNSLVYSYKVTHLSVLILLSGSTKFSLSQTFARVEESETLKKRSGDEMRQHRHRSCVPRYRLSTPHCCHIHIYTSSTTGMKKGENSCQENWIKERPVGSHDFCHI